MSNVGLSRPEVSVISLLQCDLEQSPSPIFQLFGANRTILRSLVLSQYQRVTDRQTDGRTHTTCLLQEVNGTSTSNTTWVKNSCNVWQFVIRYRLQVKKLALWKVLSGRKHTFCYRNSVLKFATGANWHQASMPTYSRMYWKFCIQSINQSIISNSS